MATKRLLVVGATGKQGGALIDALLATPTSNPFTIYGLTRSTTSAAAQRLRAKNVTLIRGDTRNPAPIFAQLGPRGSVWAVFSMTLPGKDEEDQAIPLIDAALAAGVRHFVFTSADRGGPARSDVDPSPVPHFITKFNIEQHLKARSAAAAASPDKKKRPDDNEDRGPMAWTILRPAAFYENLSPDLIGRTFARILSQLGPSGTTKINLTSSADVGLIAARALLAPQDSASKTYTLVGDTLSHSTMNAIFREEIGHDMPLAPGWVAALAQWAVPDMGSMFRWFGEGNYCYDVGFVKEEVPGLKDFRTWLREGGGGWVGRKKEG